MANYRLNPLYITAPRGSMPQIGNGRATTQLGHIDTTPLGVATGSSSSMPTGDVSGLMQVLGNGSLLTSIVNMVYDQISSKQQREWNEQMMDKQNEWSLNMWNMTNEYNSPSSQMQRLRDAGLNPLYYGLDGTSANSFQSAQPLGFQRSVVDIENPIAAGLDAAAKKAQIENINAATDKIKSETSSIGLDNEFKQKTMDARVEGIELANSATKETIEYTKVQREKGLKEISKIIEETKTESERRNLIVLQQAVQKATEKQILELLPYQKNLMAAQSYAQKCIGYASEVKAMMDKQLLDKGYPDQIFEQLKVAISKDKAIVRKEQAIAQAQDFINMIHNGKFFEVGDSWFANNLIEGPMNALLQDLSVIQAVFPVKLGASL